MVKKRQYVTFIGSYHRWLQHCSCVWSSSRFKSEGPCRLLLLVSAIRLSRPNHTSIITHTLIYNIFIYIYRHKLRVCLSNLASANLELKLWLNIYTWSIFVYNKNMNIHPITFLTGTSRLQVVVVGFTILKEDILNAKKSSENITHVQASLNLLCDIHARFYFQILTLLTIIKESF